MKAVILTIGDEILIGQIVDTNAVWLAQQLNAIGVEVVKMMSVKDEIEEMHRGIEQALAVADMVLSTGGLGPTKDDITKHAIAQYFDDELVFHQPSYDLIARMFQERNIPLRDAHRDQCLLPSQASYVPNNMGTAQGIWMEKNGKVLLSMPGIPYEMKAIMTTGGGLEKIKTSFKTQAIVHKTILTAGLGETSIAAKIEPISNILPDHIKLAFLPSLGKVRVRLSAVGEEQKALETEVEKYAGQIANLIPDLIYGYDIETLESAVGKLLIEKGLRIGTCESCTGGLLGHRITSVPGSSAYYDGSIVAYSYELKETLLNVSKKTLDTEGAVCESTVLQMVSGGLDKLNTDIIVSISGIAGPGGGTKEKPVGTIWLAIGNKNIQLAKKILIGKDRSKNIEFTVNYALNMIRLFVNDNY